MTEKEFYQLKILDKISLIDLRNQHPTLIKSFVLWYRSKKYIEIQDFKTYIKSKFKQIKAIENLEIEITNDEFYQLFEWYSNQPKKCHYCKLPENEMENLHLQDGHVNKRYPKRGKSLELERKISSLPYTEFDNLVLACYWCNNAKTDTFTEKEFEKVGVQFNKIWENRIGKSLT